MFFAPSHVLLYLPSISEVLSTARASSSVLPRVKDIQLMKLLMFWLALLSTAAPRKKRFHLAKHVLHFDHVSLTLAKKLVKEWSSNRFLDRVFCYSYIFILSLTLHIISLNGFDAVEQLIENVRMQRMDRR